MSKLTRLVWLVDIVLVILWCVYHRNPVEDLRSPNDQSWNVILDSAAVETANKIKEMSATNVYKKDADEAKEEDLRQSTLRSVEPSNAKTATMSSFCTNETTTTTTTTTTDASWVSYLLSYLFTPFTSSSPSSVPVCSKSSQKNEQPVIPSNIEEELKQHQVGVEEGSVEQSQEMIKEGDGAKVSEDPQEENERKENKKEVEKISTEAGDESSKENNNIFDVKSIGSENDGEEKEEKEKQESDSGSNLMMKRSSNYAATLWDIWTGIYSRDQYHQQPTWSSMPSVGFVVILLAICFLAGVMCGLQSAKKKTHNQQTQLTKLHSSSSMVEEKQKGGEKQDLQRSGSKEAMKEDDEEQEEHRCAQITTSDNSNGEEWREKSYVRGHSVSSTMSSIQSTGSPYNFLTCKSMFSHVGVQASPEEDNKKDSNVEKQLDDTTARTSSLFGPTSSDPNDSDIRVALNERSIGSRILQSVFGPSTTTTSTQQQGNNERQASISSSYRSEYEQLLQHTPYDFSSTNGPTQHSGQVIPPPPSRNHTSNIEQSLNPSQRTTPPHPSGWFTTPPDRRITSTTFLAGRGADCRVNGEEQDSANIIIHPSRMTGTHPLLPIYLRDEKGKQLCDPYFLPEQSFSAESIVLSTLETSGYNTKEKISEISEGYFLILEIRYHLVYKFYRVKLHGVVNNASSTPSSSTPSPNRGGNISRNEETSEGVSAEDTPPTNNATNPQQEHEPPSTTHSSLVTPENHHHRRRRRRQQFSHDDNNEDHEEDDNNFGDDENRNPRGGGSSSTNNTNTNNNNYTGDISRTPPPPSPPPTTFDNRTNIVLRSDTLYEVRPYTPPNEGEQLYCCTHVDHCRGNSRLFGTPWVMRFADAMTVEDAMKHMLEWIPFALEEIRDPDRYGLMMQTTTVLSFPEWKQTLLSRYFLHTPNGAGHPRHLLLNHRRRANSAGVSDDENEEDPDI